jgi:hypothetical protein
MMRNQTQKRALIALLLLVTLGGCSGPEKPPEPTEAEIHADEKQRLAWHPYRCDDGSTAFVKFSDDGLRIDLKISSRGDKVAALTAPAAGLQYVGESSTATLTESRLVLAGAGVGGNRNCERANTF